jgi:uncharacterized delta-60 repeat protein
MKIPFLHWKYQNDGKSYFEDRGFLTEFDNNGNVIVAGYEETGCSEFDIAVTKYSQQGDTLWHFTYDGAGSYGQDDIPSAMAIDPFGNIYICGRSEDNFFPYALTMKLAPNGALLWSNRYLAAESEANDICVSATGEVYICGYMEISNNKDFLVIKYNNSGTQQWMQNYTNGNHDQAIALETDGSGNLYVTGKRSGVNALYDWVTIKYDAAGNQQWADVYSSTQAGYSEEPVCLAIDNLNNIYVAGFVPVSSGSNRDYYVIKYSPSGSRIWECSYFNPALNSDEYPVSMAVDQGGNVFVTGNAVFNPGGQDITTVKINSTGQVAWAVHVDSINQTDYARDIAIDPTGNFIYVAGDITVPPAGFITRDIIVTKLDTSGNETARFVADGPGGNFDLPYDISVFATGTIALTGMMSMNSGGTANGDIVTMTLDPQLNNGWTRYNNGNSFADDQGADMVVDPSGNAYVCGFTKGGEITNEDLVVFKVAPNGEPLWRFVYQGQTEHSSDKAVAIAIDDQFNTYVTGVTDTGSNANIYTAKINPSGNLEWQQIYNGTLVGSDIPAGIAVAPNGNIYVAATTLNTTTLFDGTLICYDPNGNQLWATDLDKGGIAESFSALAVDAQNNAYAAGAFNAPSGALSEGLLAKFDPSGIILWDTTYDFSSATSDRDFFNCIALDDAGNVFVAGQSNFNFVTAKYSPAGNPEWIQNYSHSNFTDSATVIAIDINNDVLVGGTFGQFIEADFGIVKYKNDGTLIWDRRYANVAGSDDILTDMALDSIGNVYVTGWETDQFSTNYNFMTLKYDSAGTFSYELIWTDSLGLAPDYGKRIGIDSNGHLYIMGDANENCFGNIFVNGFRWNTQVLRYGQGIFSSVESAVSEPGSIAVYPNPAHENFTLVIPESVFGTEMAEASFFDIQGKLIFRKQYQSGQAVTVSELNGHSGLIFFTVANPKAFKTGKILLQPMKQPVH